MNLLKPKKEKVKLNALIASYIKRDIILEPDAWQHDIAARYGVNQGRVSEIKNGLRFNEIPPAT